MNFYSKKSKVGILFILVLIIILAVAGFFIARQYTKANTDYICTKVTYGACVIDNTQTQSNFSCVDGKYQRTVNGIKSIANTSFAWRRTSCPTSDYKSTVRGSSKGASGLIGSENVSVEYQSCQFIEYGDSCGGGGRTSCVPKEGEYLNSNGECVAVSPVDLCPNILDGKIHNQAYIASSSLVYNPIENKCDPKDTDVCSNPGIQRTMLGFTWRDGAGYCHTEASEVEDKNIVMDINCSTNNGQTWNDCSRVVLASRSQPIKLRPIIGGIIDKNGQYEWFDPSKAGQPIAYFDGIDPSEISNIVKPLMNLKLDTKTRFTKDVSLKFVDSNNGKYNTFTKAINIVIASQDVIIER
ncbi:MAG: hypothetical protein WC229_01530 [Candidatus Paceibacterota bacterium]|jgi:hypothetical protein